MAVCRHIITQKRNYCENKEQKKTKIDYVLEWPCYVVITQNKDESYCMKVIITNWLVMELIRRRNIVKTKEKCVVVHQEGPFHNKF